MDTHSFTLLTDSTPGLLLDNSDHYFYPTRTYRVVNGEGVTLRPDCNYFGYVTGGIAKVSFGNRPKYSFIAGMYFSSPGTFKLENTTCQHSLVLIEMLPEKHYETIKFSSFFTMGGPLETKGRLSTGEGLTQTTLIPPMRTGEPSLVHQHYTSDVVEAHKVRPHYSLSIVSRGTGYCTSPFGNVRVEAGNVFLIKESGYNYAPGMDGQPHPVGKHGMETRNSSMDLITFLPK